MCADTLVTPQPDARPVDVTASSLLATVLSLREEMLALEERVPDELAGLTGDGLASARNLIHYVALRRRDLRSLQPALAELGLSSLGRCEAHALATVEALTRALAALAGKPAPGSSGPLGVSAAAALLEERTRALLGPDPPGRRTRIVVTLGEETTAQDIHDVVLAGADLVRINCGHDGPDTWRRLAREARLAGETRGRPVRVLVDLGGPKLRTTALASGPRVVTWRPRRDALGAVLTSARVWLYPEELGALVPPEPCDAALPVPGAWLGRRVGGEAVRLVDARGKRRELRLEEPNGTPGRWAHADQRAYVVEGTELSASRGDPAGRCRVGALPPLVGELELEVGDRLLLAAGPTPAADGPSSPEPAHRESGGPEPGRGAPAIGCTLPEAVRALRAGQRVLFDDGAIEACVESCEDAGARLRVLAVRPGARLLGDKGINLPDLELDLPGFTARDEQDLDVVAELADVIGLSFVSRPEDLRAAADALARRGRAGVGLLLKIETRRAFSCLPRLLLAALHRPRTGVMIARGDLGVEIGFERLAEVQEELLWLCEAAHLPAVWATQVLEQLTKRGFPSRAEITDAAAGERAEAVMLNKGKHQARAVASLADVLQRMQGHQHKKSALLRPLHLADRLGAAP